MANDTVSMQIPLEEHYFQTGNSTTSQYSLENLDPKDAEIERLKKANFGLRLRVFHLEECTGRKDYEEDERAGEESSTMRLIRELKEELDKKNELLNSARTVIRSLKEELEQKESVDREQAWKSEKNGMGLSQIELERTTENQHFSGEQAMFVTCSDLLPEARKILLKASPCLSNYKVDIENVLDALESGAQVETHIPTWTYRLLILVNAFIDAVKEGTDKGFEAYEKSHVDHLIESTQTEPTLVFPSYFMTHLMEALNAWIRWRVQLQGVIQGDETSYPHLPNDWEHPSFTEEFLRILSSELSDWDQLVYRIKLLKEDISLTYDALEEAEILRDEAIEALETTEGERNAAFQVVEYLYKKIVPVSDDNEKADDSSISIERITELEQGILHALEERNSIYEQTERELFLEQEKWKTLTFEKHCIKEDGTLDCQVEEEMHHLKEKYEYHLQNLTDELERLKETCSNLEQERDVERERVIQVEEEAVKMVEEQVELHARETEQMESLIKEREQSNEQLEQTLEENTHMLQDYQERLNNLIEASSGTVQFLEWIDQQLLEDTERNVQNSKCYEALCSELEETRKTIDALEEEKESLLRSFYEQEESSKSKLESIQSRLNDVEEAREKLEIEAMEQLSISASLEEELSNTKQALEEEKNKVSSLNGELNLMNDKQSWIEEDKKKQVAEFESEKASMEKEMRTYAEKYETVYQDCLNLGNQIEYITDLLEQHELYSQQLEKESAEWKNKWQQVEDEKNKVEWKYQRLYEVFLETQESLFGEIRLWKGQFEGFVLENERWKQVSVGYLSAIHGEWNKMVSELSNVFETITQLEPVRKHSEGRGWQTCTLDSLANYSHSSYHSLADIFEPLEILCSNVEILLERTREIVRERNIKDWTVENDAAAGPRCITENVLKFSFSEPVTLYDKNVYVQTSIYDENHLQQIMINMISSLECSDTITDIHFKLETFLAKLDRLLEKQQTLTKLKKYLQSKNFQSPVLLRQTLSSNEEPKLRRRFSFCPATGQRMSPLRYLRLRGIEQEESMLKQMKETQQYLKSISNKDDIS